MKSKPTVLMITPSLAGGSFMAFKNLATADTEHFKYIILGLGNYKNTSPEFQIISIPYVRYDSYWGHIASKYSIIGFFFEVPLYIAAIFCMIFYSPQVVIFNGLATMLPLLPFSTLLGKKNVLSFRSWWDRERFKSIESLVRFSGKFLSLVYVNSSGTKENVSYIFPENKIMVVSHHADKLFFQQRNREQLRKKMKLENKFVILYVGRIDEEKHCDFMVETIEKLGNLQNIHYLFVGEGSMKTQIERLQKKHKSVQYLGFFNDQNQLADTYSVADVLWSNADETYLVRPAIEALACGTPLMIFKVPSIGEKITKGVEIKESLVPKEIGWLIDHRKKEETIKFIENMAEKNITADKRKSSRAYAQTYFQQDPNKELAKRLAELA